MLLVFFHTYASKAFYRMLPSFLELNADLSSTNILEHAHRLVEIANTPLPLSTSMSISQLEIYCSRLDDQIRSLSQAKVSTPSNLQNSVEVFFQELLSRCSDSHYFHIELCKNASFLFHDDVDRVDKAMRWMNEKSFEQINDKNDDKAHNRSHTKKLHILFPKEDSLNDVSVFIKQATILSNLGFPRELCEHALMITNGNESLAAQWLFDHSKSIHSTPTDDMSEYLKSLASDNWGFPGIDNFFEPKNIFFSLNSFDTVQFNRLMDGKSTLNFSKQGSSLPVKPVDVRKGLGVRISSKWLKDALLMSKQNSNTTHIWYMHTNQNTWDPFEPKVSMELEERWNSGQSCCFAMLDDESFLFHFDRMVMYHSETGYLTRIRRRNISPDVVNLVSYV